MNVIVCGVRYGDSIAPGACAGDYVITRMLSPDMITFLLYIGYLIEPIQKLNHVTEQFQEGLTAFERFMEIIEVEPDIQDAPGAMELLRDAGLSIGPATVPT